MLNTNYIAFFLLIWLLKNESRVEPHNSVPAKLICQYRMTCRPDSTSEVTTQELTQLAIADSVSEFRSCNRYKLDSLKLTYHSAPVDIANIALVTGKVRALPKYKLDGIILKLSRSKLYEYYGVINNILYKYEGATNTLNWHISPETMQIHGYACQRATTRMGGRYYTAWFTRQIPVSDGPYKFSGLPGLIVSVKDKTNSYSFELTQVYQPSINYLIREPKEVMHYNSQIILTTRDKYYEAYYTAQKNHVDDITANGSFVYENIEQIREKYKEKLKHRNNPIYLR